MARLVELDGKAPSVGSRAFVADGAYLVGDVSVGEDSSVFYGAVIRGDLAPIRIGARTNIQDNATVHVSTGVGTYIGDEVTIGHNAVIHACSIDDNVLVGMGAIVMDGAHIKKNCIVGAGAVVTQGKEFPENSLVVGAPAHVVRELTKDELEHVHEGVLRYMEIKDKLMGGNG